MDRTEVGSRVLAELVITTPCQVPWSEIDGTGPVRSCQVCQRAVLDLIELPTEQAEQAFATASNLPCARIIRAPSGEVVTADNRVPLRVHLWRGLRRRSAWAASLFAVVFLPGCSTFNRACNRFLSYGTPVRMVQPANPPAKPVTSASAPVDTAIKSPPDLD